jgi:tetratricopeptide (TPR) repeat protein
LLCFVPFILAACSTSTSVQRPAPVVDAGSHGEPTVSADTTTEEQVETYAYQPPAQQPYEPSEGNDFAENVAASPAPAGDEPVGQLAFNRPAPPAPPQTAPVQTLLAQAYQQRATDDLAGAAATLERALRIEPRNALLWNRLADVRLQQGQYAQAGNLAARSNALAGDQVGLKQDNWRIIAVTRHQRGDTTGAEEAAGKAGGGL